MFSVVICTRHRSDQLLTTLVSVLAFKPHEVIVVVNDCKTTEMALRSFGDPRVKLVVNTKNFGAGRAKHQGVLLAVTEKVLVLDDDAEVLPESDLFFALSLLDKYALVQGLILANDKHQRRRNEQPFIFFKTRSGLHEIGYFIGACHFVCRPKFIQAGGYANAEAYGFEELELSLNLLIRGEKIVFTDRFKVLHRKHKSGRIPTLELKNLMFSKRMQISYEYFPFILSFISFTIWSFFMFGRVRFSLFPGFNPRPKIDFLALLKNRFLWSRAFF